MAGPLSSPSRPPSLFQPCRQKGMVCKKESAFLYSSFAATEENCFLVILLPTFRTQRRRISDFGSLGICVVSCPIVGNVAQDSSCAHWAGTRIRPFRRCYGPDAPQRHEFPENPDFPTRKRVQPPSFPSPPETAHKCRFFSGSRIAGSFTPPLSWLKARRGEGRKRGFAAAFGRRKTPFSPPSSPAAAGEREREGAGGG